jgi:hypothetical protein
MTGCVECRNEIKHAEFDDLGNEFVCQSCGTRQTLEYECNFDEDNGEDGWFYFERVEGS